MRTPDHFGFNEKRENKYFTYTVPPSGAVLKDLLHLGEASFDQICLMAVVSVRLLFPVLISPFSWWKARALII